MSYDITSRRWETLARKDALWAILTDDAKRGRRWNVDEFFATGEREIDAVFAYLERKQLAPVDLERALDFGCGVGRLSRALAGRFAEVHGVDVSPTMIELGKKLHASHPRGKQLELVLNDKPHLRVLPSGHYAFVYSSIVLQHISYPASITYVRELMRVTKPGGLVVFQIPTEDRTPLPRRLVRMAVLRAARIARVGAFMEMNAVPRAEIERAGCEMHCELVDVTRTNSAAPDANGRLEFYDDDRGERLVSNQFVFRARR